MLRDLTGQRFGRLTVLYKGKPDKTKHTRWYCKCDCGNTKLVYKDALLTGRTVSCGCYNEEVKRRLKKRKNNSYTLNGEYGIGITHNTNKEFYFDLEDYERIKNYCWREDKNGYIVANNQQCKCIYLHRLVTNAVKGFDVDHIEHNLYDNRKSKLRVISHCDNLKNHVISANNTSGVSGVSYNRADEMWESYISVDKKKIRLGEYNNFDDAVKARKEAENKYFGEYKYNSINKEIN